MKSIQDLDRLLETMEVAVQGFAAATLDGERHFPAPPPGTILVHQVVAGSVRVLFAGRPAVACEAGATILVPPGIEMRLAPTGSDGLPMIASGAVAVRLSLTFGLLDRAKTPIVEPMRDAPIVAQICRLMLDEAGKLGQRLGARAMLNAAMKTVILMVLRAFFKRPGIDQKIISALADPRLAGPLADIIDRAAAPHSVASLAARAGLSASSFARHFAAALGMPPMEFVARARLHRAAELLRSTDMPVKSIAAQVGFASRSHFSKAFQALHGRDPTAFRESEGQKDEQAHPVDYRRDVTHSRSGGTLS